MSEEVKHEVVTEVRQEIVVEVKKDVAKEVKQEEINENQQLTHQEIGNELKLFMFHQYSPGSCFFLPHGTRIYNKLVDMLKQEYRKREYDEVMTPVMCLEELWKISGHWEHYKENMFIVEKEKLIEEHIDAKPSEQFILCPMNCSKHCLIYKSESRSFRDLPIRYADFGPLHRNEASGALRGLTRVRLFHQDDAHIFCAFEQIQSEIISCLDFLKYIYTDKLAIKYNVAISTRPDKFMGDLSMWDLAETQLKDALKAAGVEYTIKDKDGAFYGPKIDVSLTDCMNRQHQCGTIQLDFQLPEKFDLEYNASTGPLRPVIIHRAMLGSVERFIAVLTEHYQGMFPFWLSPRQIIVIPINSELNQYCEEIKKRLDKFYVDIDTSNATIQYKIKWATLLKYNRVLVVGKRELEHKTINLRQYDGKKIEMTLEEFEMIYCN